MGYGTFIAHFTKLYQKECKSYIIQQNLVFIVIVRCLNVFLIFVLRIQQGTGFIKIFKTFLFQQHNTSVNFRNYFSYFFEYSTNNRPSIGIIWLLSFFLNVISRHLKCHPEPAFCLVKDGFTVYYMHFFVISY